MAVSNNGGSSVRRDKIGFADALLSVAEEKLPTPANTTPAAKIESVVTESTSTIEGEINNPAATTNLANKVDEIVRKRNPKKHKIAGYITEELYQKVHLVCDAKDISLSDLFQAVLSEYVESSDI